MIKEFDPYDESHVRWLRKMLKSDAEHLVDNLKENPMGVQVTTKFVLEWAQTVFVLCTKYTQALFDADNIIVPRK